MSDLLAALARERAVPVVRAGDRATASGWRGGSSSAAPA